MVIKSLHVEYGHLVKVPKSHRSSVWIDIVRDVHLLKEKGIDLLTYCKKKVGNGETSIFWDDVWMGDTSLKIQYPRVYAFELEKTISVAENIAQNSVNDSSRRAARDAVESVQLSELESRFESFNLVHMQDHWIWSMTGTGDFSVASVRSMLNDHRLPVVSFQTRWINVMPIKINVFAWEVRLDKLPTRLNISLKKASYSFYPRFVTSMLSLRRTFSSLVL
ncbi:hypothetical protein Tco_0592470 [Tanacetum coccineum]